MKMLKIYILSLVLLVGFTMQNANYAMAQSAQSLLNDLFSSASEEDSSSGSAYDYIYGNNNKVSISDVKYAVNRKCSHIRFSQDSYKKCARNIVASYDLTSRQERELRNIYGY